METVTYRLEIESFELEISPFNLEIHPLNPEISPFNPENDAFELEINPSELEMDLFELEIDTSNWKSTCSDCKYALPIRKSICSPLERQHQHIAFRRAARGCKSLEIVRPVEPENLLACEVR